MVKNKDINYFIIFVITIVLLLISLMFFFTYDNNLSNSTNIKITCINNNNTYMKIDIKDSGEAGDGFPISFEYCGKLNDINDIINKLQVIE